MLDLLRDDELLLTARQPAPPVAESFAFGAPVVTDAADNTYTLGLDWTTSANGLWRYVDWFTPTGAPTVTTRVVAFADGVVVNSRVFELTPAELGTLVRLQLLADVAVVPGVTYTAAIFTNHYTATNAYPFPAATAHMTAPVGNGKFFAAGVVTYPSNVGGNYHISPVAIY